MCDIVYVILHFLTIKDTVEAVDSIIKKSGNENYRIVIVDNGSDNGTGEKLSEMYKESERIKVLLSDSNLGFARGNNIGIKFAVNEYNPKFVVAMNNDIIMQQDNFYELIIEEYENSHFAVLGPKVITADGREDSSPVRKASIDKRSIMKTCKMERFLYIVDYLHLFWVLQLLNWFVKKAKKNIKKGNLDPYFMKRHENVVLHGCFLIFSKDYFFVYDGFDESTFLYHEEEILYLKTSRCGLKLVYNPKLMIYHKEDSASEAMIPNSRNNRMFKLKHCMNSNRELIRIEKEMS